MTTRKKILFLIPTLRGGGAERVFTTLLKHFDRKAFDLTLAVVDTRGAVYRDEIPSDIPFVDLGSRRVRYALPKIVRCIWTLRPHVVFSTLGHLNLALGLLRPFLPRGVRLVCRETTIVSHGLKRYRLPRVWAFGYRWFYPRIDLLVCQSNAMREDLALNFGFPRHKTTVINNPIDLGAMDQRSLFQTPLRATEHRAAADNTLRLVAAGRLTWEKGFDLLIDAIAQLGDRRVYVRVLGEGPLEGELRQRAAASGISDRFEFLGFVKSPYSYFAAADAFVLSSRYEGFPNVVLEALACGTPVIATPAPGGTREILGPIPECEIAEAVTSSALAAAIRRWRSRLPGRVARARLQPYDVSLIARQYQETLSRVAAL